MNNLHDVIYRKQRDGSTRTDRASLKRAGTV